MPAPGAGIHVLLYSVRRQRKTWIAGTSPAMTWRGDAKWPESAVNNRARCDGLRRATAFAAQGRSGVSHLVLLHLRNVSMTEETSKIYFGLQVAHHRCRYSADAFRLLIGAHTPQPPKRRSVRPARIPLRVGRLLIPGWANGAGAREIPAGPVIALSASHAEGRNRVQG